jgi:hypothetical protein
MHMDLYVFFIPLYFALSVSGAICTHPQEHKLRRTAIGMCNGYEQVLYGTPSQFSTVKSELDRAKSVRVSQPLPAPMG